MLDAKMFRRIADSIFLPTRVGRTTINFAVATNNDFAQDRTGVQSTILSDQDRTKTGNWPMSTEVGATPITNAAEISKRMTTGELANLDFLRAVAVGLVFIGHLFLTMRIRGLGNLGHFGVLLFFVHTALVLMMSMERLGLSRGSLYAAFVIRRVFRIYPLSIVSVIAVVILRVPPTSWIGGGYNWAGWQAFLSNIFLTQNLTQSNSVIGVLWSLPFEIQMYAILPLLFAWALCFPSLRAMYTALLMTVAIAVSEYVLRFGSCNADFLLTRYFPCFFAGVCAWRLMKIRTPRFSGLAWVVFLMTLVLTYRATDALRVYGPAVLGAMHGLVRNDHRIWWPSYLDLVNDWLFCSSVGLAIPLFLEIRNRWLKLISKYIARYSYGIYVSHVPILWFCFMRFRVGSTVVIVPLAILLTGVISVFLYHCLENPAISVGRRIAARAVQRRAFA
jgi:peptidoglycan/LPS O-acetylase OafA/YrhL